MKCGCPRVSSQLRWDFFGGVFMRIFLSLMIFCIFLWCFFRFFFCDFGMFHSEFGTQWGVWREQITTLAGVLTFKSQS